MWAYGMEGVHGGTPAHITPHVQSLVWVNAEGGRVPAPVCEDQPEQKGAPLNVNAGLFGQGLDAARGQVAVCAAELEPERHAWLCLHR